jgi:hypothetical protein
VLSIKTIEDLKQLDELSIWNYLTSLQQVQNALFILEKQTDDPENLKDLSARALEIGRELDEIFNLLAESEEDE